MSAYGKELMTRRGFLRYVALGAGATLFAACKPEVIERVVKETVEVEKIVKETVEVEGAVEVVEKVVTATPAPIKTKLIVNAYTPSEWTERSAEHPTVTNAPRILAENYKDVEPNLEVEWLRFVAPEGGSGDTYYSAWLDALVASGTAPDVVNPMHWVPIQKGYCLPIEEFLQQPSQFASQYSTWQDSFYPSVMKAARYADGHTYTAQVSDKIAGFEIGMMCNMDWFDTIGMDPPKTWTEQLAVGEALKEAGSSWIPWPNEAKEGCIWSLGLQLLPSIFQTHCPDMDTDGDMFVGAEECLPAFRAGTVGPLTPTMQAGWRQQKAVVDHWPDGWTSADLEVMWRQGQIGMRQTGGWEVTAQYSDPEIKFERILVPPPPVTSADIPEGNDPQSWTPGDGTLWDGALTLINGPDTAVMKITEERNTVLDAIHWLQWITEPENCAFLVNENEALVPAVKDAAIGPLWGELLRYQMPLYNYTIAYWGECLYFDATHYNEIRKLFVSWATGQMDDDTFFRRQHEETAAGADRYEESLA